MPVKKHLIETTQQAADYAYGSYLAARAGVCKSRQVGYLDLYNSLKNGYLGPIDGLVNKVMWEVALQTADNYCQSAPDYKKPGTSGSGSSTGGATTPGDAAAGGNGGPGQQYPGDQLPAPYTAAGLGGGIPWWLWAVGGGVLYLMFGKKGRKKKRA